MNKVHLIAKPFRNGSCPYMLVSNLDMDTVRHFYRVMRRDGMYPIAARRAVYQLLSAGRASISSFEIDAELNDPQLLDAF